MIARLQSVLGDRYRVERQLGSGGMALVFLAQDLKHGGRPVAIKVLRPELAVSLGPDRFNREIEIAARLQHPNIVPVYDSGAADGIFYYVMPFVEGESLRDLLNRERRLSPDRARGIARDIAAALQYAHTRDVVHRDIKPENVMLSAGQAVVTDFGIARAISVAGGQRLTGTGFAVGTPSYMSPEQALGDEQIDGRSDIYSTGCVLYEMIAGEPPFSGGTVQAIVAQSLTGPRPRLRTLRPDTPASIDAVVDRALAREPADRYATAAEFAQALETGDRRRPDRRATLPVVLGAMALVVVALGAWWLRGRQDVVPDAGEIIAVMPFSTSGDGVEFLHEGMMDLLSKNLDAVGGIRAVDPRTVLHRWRKRAGDGDLDRPGALAVGRDAGAGSVVLGSIVAAGPTVRISADLTALDGRVLARASADGPTDKVLQLVDSLSLRLLREIWRSSAPLPSMQLSGITTGSVDAVRAYLAGEQFYRRSQWDSAITAFKQALEIDSTFALASFRLSVAMGWRSGFSAESRAASEAAVRHAAHLPARERTLTTAHRMFGRSESAARDTMLAFVSRYPDDAEGWHLLGDVQFHGAQVYGLDLPDMYQPFERSLELDPTYTPSYEHLIDLSLHYGDSARFFRSLARWDSVGRASESAIYRAAGTARWVHHDSLAVAMARATRERPGVVGILGGSVLRAPDIPPEQLFALLDSSARLVPAQQRIGFTFQRAGLYFGLGQLTEGRKVALTLASVSPQAPVEVSQRPVAVGIAPPAYAQQWARDLAALPKSEEIRRTPQGRYWSVVQLLSRGDRAGARTAIREAQAAKADTLTNPLPMRFLFQGLQGWLAVLDGDTVAGIQQLRRASLDLGFGGPGQGLGTPLRFALASVLAARPDTRDEGIARLRYGLGYDPIYLAPAMYKAAEALEAKGDREGAALAYGDFLRLWKNADPELQPKVEAARAALARLTGEPKGR